MPMLPAGGLLAILGLVALGAAEFWYPLLHFLQPGILWPGLAVFKPMILVAAIVLIRTLDRRAPGSRDTPFAWPALNWLLVFVAIQVVSVYRGGLGTILAELMFFLPLIVFTVASIRVVGDEAQLRRFLHGTIVGCMVVIVYGLLAALLGWESAIGGRAGAYGMYENHNDYTFIVLMVLPFIVACWRDRPAWPIRWLLVASALTCMAGVFLSLSRGGMLALALQCLFMLLAFTPRWVAVVTMPVMLAVALVAVQIQFAAREANQGSSYTAHDAEASRYELWRAAAKMVKAHPLLGVGSRTFGEVSEQYNEISGDNRGKNSHNTYIEVVAGTGLLGLGAFLAMLWTTGRSLRRHPLDAPTGLVALTRSAALAALLTIMFRALLDAKQIDFSFYLLVAVAVICDRLAPRPESASASASPSGATRDRDFVDRPGRRNGRRIPAAPGGADVTSDTRGAGRHRDNTAADVPAARRRAAAARGRGADGRSHRPIRSSDA